jgi:hypothetical protein
LLCLFQLGHQRHDPTSQYLNLPSFFAVKWTWTRLFSDLHVKLRQFAKIISIRFWHPSSKIKWRINASKAGGNSETSSRFTHLVTSKVLSLGRQSIPGSRLTILTNPIYREMTSCQDVWKL